MNDLKKNGVVKKNGVGSNIPTFQHFSSIFIDPAAMRMKFWQLCRADL
jgi:hypothetical protein